MIDKIIRGLGTGIIIGLVPAALLSTLFKYLEFDYLVNSLNIISALTCAIIGICIALQFKFDQINTATLSVSTLIAAQNILYTDNKLILNGPGDILNAILGSIIAILLIKQLDSRLGPYKLFLMPLIVIISIAIISNFTINYVSQITIIISNTIIYFTKLHPFIMSALIATSFGIIIVSPLSSVALALIIGLEGINSAAANIGIVTISISLAILSKKSTSFGMSLAHIFGSPKLQLENFIKKPIILLPGIISVILVSPLVPILSLQGTPMSAGFGLIGFLGPLTHLNIVGYNLNNIIITIISFIIIPTIICYTVIYVFKKKTKIISSKDYIIKT